MGICLILARSPRRGRLRAGWSTRTGLPLALLCAANGPAILLLWSHAAREPGRLAAQLAVVGLSGTGLVLFALYYATVHPVLEELFWRGLLGSDARGVTLTDLAFAGYHLLVLPLFLDLPWALAAAAILAAASWTWRQALRRHGGLAIPMAAHAAAGIATMAALFALLD